MSPRIGGSMNNRAQHTLKRAESLPIIEKISLEQDQQRKILQWLRIENVIKNIYGNDAIKFLKNKKINLQYLVSRYNPDKHDQMDIIAEVASSIVLECEKQCDDWLHELYLQLLRAIVDVTKLASRGDENNNEKNILYLEKLRLQGLVIVNEITMLRKSKNLSKKEIQKIATSFVYVIAALQDPFNQDLAIKLEKNATQTIGSEDKLRQLYRAFVAFSGLITAFLGMPFTLGASFAMVYVGGLVFSAGSASFFYHREHSIAKGVSGLSNVMKSKP